MSIKKQNNKRELAIDKAVYLVDDNTKTYQFLRRNPDWKKLSQSESFQNQKQIEGYTRIFRTGKTRIFRYDESPSRKARRLQLEKNKIELKTPYE